MAMLRKFGELSQKLFLRNGQHVYIIMRYKTNIDIDSLHDVEYPELEGVIPSPYPKTEEEKRKSAEKYNLHPEEYKPFPPDHRYTGDYPELPEIGVAAKDPFYPWDYPQTRRCHGEPLPKRFNLLTQDRFGFGPRQRISDGKRSLIFLSVLAGTYAIFAIAPETSQPLMEKQYPGHGEHYIFELVK